MKTYLMEPVWLLFFSAGLLAILAQDFEVRMRTRLTSLIAPFAALICGVWVSFFWHPGVMDLVMANLNDDLVPGVKAGTAVLIILAAEALFYLAILIPGYKLFRLVYKSFDRRAGV